MINKDGINYKTKEAYKYLNDEYYERCDWNPNVRSLFYGDTILWAFVEDHYQGFAKIISLDTNGIYKFLDYSWCSCWSDQDTEELERSMARFDNIDQLRTFINNLHTDKGSCWDWKAVKSMKEWADPSLMQDYVGFMSLDVFEIEYKKYDPENTHKDVMSDFVCELRKELDECIEEGMDVRYIYSDNVPGIVRFSCSVSDLEEISGYATLCNYRFEKDYRKVD